MRNKKRRQALDDFYAYCRLVDDIADEKSLPLLERKQALESIRKWLENPKLSENHPFWLRFENECQALGIKKDWLMGILNGVAHDLAQEENFVEFKTWDDLNLYVQGVACDVGQAVLQILGASGLGAKDYSTYLGRCVQYLNIMRDLEEDFENERNYIPFCLLEEMKISRAKELGASEFSQIRFEFYHRAIEYRKKAVPYSWKCFPAEIMVGVYIRASKKYWRYGNNQRLKAYEALPATFFSSIHFIQRMRKQKKH